MSSTDQWAAQMVRVSMASYNVRSS